MVFEKRPEITHLIRKTEIKELLRWIEITRKIIGSFLFAFPYEKKKA